MIWMTLAFATTPEDLAAQLPEARAQLTACEQACKPEAGARAAFVVAVGTYVETGVADGTLAATVQALDPALFAKLPPVIQEASSTPLAWARTAPDSIAGQPILAQQIDMPTVPAPWPIEMTVRVRDGAGEPVKTARVEVVGEEIARSVDDQGSWKAGGVWKSTPLAPVEGRRATHIEPVYFEKGQAVTVLVTAPGYTPVSAVMVLTKNPKKNVFTLVMQPTE